MFQLPLFFRRVSWRYWGSLNLPQSFTPQSMPIPHNTNHHPQYDRRHAEYCTKDRKPIYDIFIFNAQEKNCRENSNNGPSHCRCKWTD